MAYFITTVKQTLNTVRHNCSEQFCVLAGTTFLYIFLWIVPFSLLLSSNQVLSLLHIEYSSVSFGAAWLTGVIYEYYFNGIHCMALSGRMMMDDDWITCRRKQSLPMLWYFPTIYLEGMKETVKVSVWMTFIPGHWIPTFWLVLSAH